MRHNLGLSPGTHARREVLDLEAVLVVARDADELPRAAAPLELDLEVLGAVHEGGRNADPAGRPEHLDLMAVRLGEARADQRGSPVAEVQDAGELVVDAGRGEVHGRRGRDRLRSEQPPRRVDAVVPDVVERAAAELGLHPHVLRARDREREDRADEPRVADRPVAEPLEDDLPLRVEAVHECLHPDDAAVDAVLDQVGGLRARARGGLLAQDVLAGVGRALRPLGVQVVRQRDVDRIDVGCLDQLVVGARADRLGDRTSVGVRELGLGEELGGPLRAARDRDELDVLRAEDRRDDDLARDVRGAEDPDSHPAMLTGGRG